ncbi:MAG: dihydroorotase [Verrucomicrobia bacterium]|nr:dihydroorotase [Verrucomicrobiota bacterium]
MDSLTIPIADDFHLHLRQDAMMHVVAPLVRAGGVGRCVVMPNTTPPIATAEDAIRYRGALEALAPDVEFLMTLYLLPELTPQAVSTAAAQGVFGVKCYPKGVTTNSESGTEDFGAYDAVFSAMEAEGLALLIHGEVPSNAEKDVCVLNAEARFLPELEKLHGRFPKLRIVLEHVTTAKAVDCVKALGSTVAATVTAHHLDLTVDDWAGRNHNFCKPVAKYPHDRDALRQVVCEGHPRFFLGSDSAPHPRSAKESACGCAGVFTSPLLLPYLADTFDRLGCLDRLADFTSTFGCAFHGLPPSADTITLERRAQPVPAAYGDIVPYRAGQTLLWQR